MFHKASKGKGGVMLTKDVDTISRNPLDWGKMGKLGTKSPTSGLDSVSGTSVEPRPIAWDRINK